MSSSTSDHETSKWKSSQAVTQVHFGQRPRSQTLPTNPGPIATQLEHLQKLGVAPFLKSLYTILSLEDPLIIGWTVDGRAFEVRDQDRLSHVILPKYFRHQKFSSFQRQLNYFGFKKLTKSHANVCTYLREHFHRYSPRALILIKRKTNGTRQPPLSLDDLESSYNHSPRALLESEYFYPAHVLSESHASVHETSPSHPPVLHLPPTRFHPHPHAQTAEHHHSAFGNYRHFPPHATTAPPSHSRSLQHPWDNQYWVLSTSGNSATAIDQILYEGEEETESGKHGPPPLMSSSISSLSSSMTNNIDTKTLIQGDAMSASDLVALRDAVAMICDDDELLGSVPVSDLVDKENNTLLIKREKDQNHHPVQCVVNDEEEARGSVRVTV